MDSSNARRNGLRGVGETMLRSASGGLLAVLGVSFGACEEPASVQDAQFPWFLVIGTPQRNCEKGKAWNVSGIHYYSDVTTLTAHNGCWERTDGETVYIDYVYRAKDSTHDGTHAWYRRSLDHVGNAVSGATMIASYVNRKSDTTYSGTENTRIPPGTEGVQVWLEAGSDTGDPGSLWIYVYTQLSPPGGAVASSDSLVITVSWVNSEVHSSVRTIVLRYKDGEEVGADTFPNTVSSWRYGGLVPGLYRFAFSHDAGPIISVWGENTGVSRLSEMTWAGPATIIEPPQDVQCEAPFIGTSHIDVSWANTSATHEVEIWRADFTAKSGFQPVASVSAGSSGYLDQTTQSGHWYSYRVRYVRGSNTGAFSEVCSIQAP